MVRKRIKKIKKILGSTLLLPLVMTLGQGSALASKEIESESPSTKRRSSVRTEDGKDKTTTTSTMNLAITSPDDQLNRLIDLKRGRAPDASFPELLQQFRENSAAIERMLDGDNLVAFQKISNSALEFFGPEGQNLTLPHFNVAHLYYATILGAQQRGSHVISSGETIHNNFKKAMETAFNKTFSPSSLSYFLNSEIIKPLMYIEHGLYPYTIVSLDGNLSIEGLMKSMAHDISLSALPLTRTKFDGRLDANAETFIGHDWAHNSPHFNAISSRNYEGASRFKAIHDLVANNPDKNTRNLDYFCLFFIEHEAHYFHRGKNLDLESATERGLNFLLKTNLSNIFKESALVVDGVTTMDVFKQYMPNKEEPFILGDIPDSVPQDLRIPIYHFQYAYNLLFDIQEMLKESNVDFPIWQGNDFNAVGMKKILKDVFYGFQERYAGKF
jgi:hypothetical protein